MTDDAFLHFATGFWCGWGACALLGSYLFKRALDNALRRQREMLESRRVPR